VVLPTAHRWVPVSCLPATAHEVNYAILSSGPAYGSDFKSTATTHTVPSVPPVALSFEPLPVPASKAQPVVPSLFVNPPTPPAPVVTQPQVVLRLSNDLYCVEWGVKLTHSPQVVLVKQFQPPKPYTGASSWQGYREYFERPGHS